MDQEGRFCIPGECLIAKDTVFKADSLSVDSLSALPIDSLWSKSTLTAAAINDNIVSPSSATPKETVSLSLLVLAFFIVIVIFSRETLTLFPLLLKSLFKLRNHYRLEEKLSLTIQRNILALISAIYFPLMLSLISGTYIQDRFSINTGEFLLISTGIIILFWLVKKGFYYALSWMTKDRNTFRFVEKVGYNHLIISVLFTFPSIIVTIFWPDIEFIIRLNILIYCCLFVYLMFIVRSYQIIISNHYSRFFYILYLCTLELLPVALIANTILSL